MLAAERYYGKKKGGEKRTVMTLNENIPPRRRNEEKYPGRKHPEG